MPGIHLYPIRCLGRVGRYLWTSAAKAGLLLTAYSLISLCPTEGFAQRTRLKPGMNFFSTKQDVEMGQEVSKEAEQQLQILNDRKVDDYLNRLGRRLGAKAPGEKYPYQFKGVDDMSINAFALPGGFLYVNRGTIEAADSEAQLAGVMGHEIGHVALRHGTNQASKALFAKFPLAIASGLMGNNSMVGVLTQLGGGFVANSVLLKFSRDAERQADLIGTQILYDNNYDPREMARFFEKLLAGDKNRSPEFFSSHPNPEHRIEGVDAEVVKMGGRLGSYTNDSSEFREIQKYVRSLPAPPKPTAKTPASSGDGRTNRPPKPSARLQNFDNKTLTLDFPENWRSYEREDTLTLAPEGGMVDDGRGNSSLAYGVMKSAYKPQTIRRSGSDIEYATDRLIDKLHESNQALKVARDPSRIRVDGTEALSLELSNDSPLGGKERLWLVTVMRTEGLVYFLFIAPEQDFPDYDPTFQEILRSVRFSRR